MRRRKEKNTSQDLHMYFERLADIETLLGVVMKKKCRIHKILIICQVLITKV